MPVVYCSETLALAMLEVRVHLQAADVDKDLVAFQFQLPLEAGLEEFDASSLPDGWNDHDLIHPSTMNAGRQWLARANSAAILVPSVILPAGAFVPGDRNILLNPVHPGMSRLEIARSFDFQLDKRLFEAPE